jgi:hypothetical protein
VAFGAERKMNNLGSLREVEGGDRSVTGMFMG